MDECIVLQDSLRKNLFTDLLSFALTTFSAETGMIAIFNHENNCLQILAGIGLFQEHNKGICLSTREGIAGYVFSTGETVIIDDAHPPPINLAYHRSRDRCSICIPLKDLDGNIIGVVALNKQEGRFVERQIPIFEFITTQIAVIIEEIRLRAQREKIIETLNLVSRIYQNIKVTTSIEKAYSGILQAACMVSGIRRGIIIKESHSRICILASNLKEKKTLTEEQESSVLEALLELRRLTSIVIVSDGSAFSSLFKDLNGHSLVACSILSYDIHRNWGILLLETERGFEEMMYLSLQVVRNLAEAILENIRLLQHNERLTVRQERINLAREIHDGLTQSLISLRMQAEYLAEVATREGGMIPLNQFSERFMDVLTFCINESRKMLTNLRKQGSSPGQIKEIIEKTMREWSFRIIQSHSFHITLNESMLPVMLKRIIIGVLREAIINVGKHSEATHLRVKICQLKGWVYLLIKDNGKGFDVEETRRKKSCFGLVNMEERVKNIKGELRIHSRIGHGTTIKVGLPFI